MKPVVALVGRPNVGKSTLFNALTRTRDALVLDLPGTTRDRQYGEALLDEREVVVVDTGGLSGEEEGIDKAMSDQVMLALEEANVVLMIVDARAGLTTFDEVIAQFLREKHKSVLVVCNKIDGIDEDQAGTDFYSLGFGEPVLLSAAHRQGLQGLSDRIVELLPPVVEEASTDQHLGIKVALVGRPNVGKSTLTNRLLGEDRVVVFDQPGTTRDSIYVSLQHHGKPYTFIDTAGVRRRSRVEEVIEKFSIVKTLAAIEDADVVIVVMDGSEGITDQDLHLIGFALEAGRAVVLAINKWDHLSQEQRQNVQQAVDRRLQFVSDFVDIHYISAKHGTNVGHLYKSIDHAYSSANQEISTADLNRVLEAAVRDHSPPMVDSRRIKLRYAHLGGHNPLVVVIHGNQLERLPDSYKRYLVQTFRRAFKLRGVGIRIQVKTSANPYV
ncbi:MAG: ribosome biogenesis GTPase Der [Gammaproteobacteria bacterium]|nr:ribosome biogenesis GTPase Der [Gammaproteobacteria bacterium]